MSSTAKKALRDLIVVLPGITGSVLREDDRDVWALSGHALWSWVASGGDSLRRLRLRDGDRGGVVAERLMPTAHLVPGLVKIETHSSIMETAAPCNGAPLVAAPVAGAA